MKFRQGFEARKTILMRIPNQGHSAFFDDLDDFSPHKPASPNYFYKQCGFEICIPLSIIFERSLNDECLPCLLKTAIVAAVHKKGDRTRPDNKRNVSLTCTPSKLFESVIAETIYSNADTQGLIDPN